MKKTRISLLLANMMLSDHLWAAGAYDINKSYPGGSQVNYNGQVFEARWWANPGQTPGVVAANEWDTTWKLIVEGGVTPPDTGSGDKPTPPDGSTITVYMSQAEVDAKELALTDFPAMAAVKASIVTRDNLVVEAVQPGRADNPDNVKRVEGVLSESQFNYLFPLRAPEYTYRGLLQAVAKFPALCSDYSDADAICRKSLATMFAHLAQDTGGHESSRPEAEWRQALIYVREKGWTETITGGYNAECHSDVWQGQQWPCGTFDNGEFKSYFGRGAKQLSYNYNYGPFSEVMFGTVRTLLDRPDLVADTWLNLASAVFFYIYPQPPKPSVLHVIDGTWQPNDHDRQSGLIPGFGVTTQIINGRVECGGSAEHAQSQNRINYYREFANYLGVPVSADEVLGCKGMNYFDEKGTGSLSTYWDLDWRYVAENPNGGKSYACQLVGYQTRFSAFKKGDYSRCVQHFYPEVVIEDNGGGTNLPPVATITGPAQAEGGGKVILSAQHSSDPEDKPLAYSWTIPAGTFAPALDQVTLELTLPNSVTDTKLDIKLTVTDEGGLSRSTNHVLW
ncbi:TPA: glycoside hydrolase family 19 protein [Aeromonas veronii]